MFAFLVDGECVALLSQIKPGVPNTFDGNRVKSCAFLTSCELYLSLTGFHSLDNQTCIHWTLSYFKSGHAATFAK
jgi:hypothetical protein